MHEQMHRPPVHQPKPPEPVAQARSSIRRPLDPHTGEPVESLQHKADSASDAAPPAEPPSIIARILRGCASCGGGKVDEDERLPLSQPGEPLEQEADRVAARVMRQAVGTPPALRAYRQQDDEALVARAASASGARDGAASLVNEALRSPGRPLDAQTRSFMEPRIGRDFGDVVVHTGDRASLSTEAVSALAYTVGHHVVFRSGQYAPETTAGARLLAHELTHVAQQAPDAPLQRDPAASDTVAAPAKDAATPDGSAMSGGKVTAASGVLVEDDETQPLDPRQMRKSAFLSALRARVDEVVDAGYSSLTDRLAGRAVVVARFAMYSAQSAKSLEQTLRREVGGAASAAGYMGAVVARVKAEVAADEAEKKAAAAKGDGVFFKGREGGAREADDPRVVKAALGHEGQPLPSGVRSGLEAAMGQDFSGVRVHTGATAAKVSGELNARALTVGQDIAFGAGEYRPGTPVGDALIAHELAHVVQQGIAPDAAVAAKSEGAHDGPLEAAADESAMGAVLSLWGGVKAGALGLARKAGAALKTGLKLQRCGSHKDATIKPTEEELGKHINEEMGKINEGKNRSETSGVWYLGEYQEFMEKNGHKWNKEDQKKYGNGYADPDYFTRTNYMTWTLKRKRRASLGLRAWFAGLTIAECASVSAAIQYSAVLAAVGDKRFDRYFGSDDDAESLEVWKSGHKLVISSEGVAGTPIASLMKDADAPSGTIGHRQGLDVGRNYFFKNHPDYLKKHPNGSWQGENAIYEGEKNGVQLWSGFGAGHKTEEQMLIELVGAFNAAGTTGDTTLDAKQTTVQELVAPPLNGGLQIKTGFKLDPSKVQNL